ncbi:DUF7940 domain-containing protein [Chelatococcus asaccharovorans]|uniref:DUF7940 domain-containing protein n=1 Tax=Chelatococcus asaccharovorans TaxID=28210 RepID=UPI00224C6E0F|nr:hypothetical protein [Chelatococcus asaccharovorans]CAH1672224.1 conserved hypothetical protein [Chelatococcus asaccharovorans]CAH1676360.1 conserved hypothetical protein [Chelatococcus asaccharovorans]
MRLVPNWPEVLRYAWSIRLLILAGALSGAEVALPLLQDILPIHRGVFAGLSALTVCGAFVARIVAQNSVSGENQ